MFKNIILKMFLVGMQLKDHSRVSKIFFLKNMRPASVFRNNQSIKSNKMN